MLSFKPFCFNPSKHYFYLIPDVTDTFFQLSPILDAHCSLTLLIVACDMSMESNYSWSLYLQHTLASDECWDMSSLFMSPFYPQETRSYEQSHGDENV